MMKPRRNRNFGPAKFKTNHQQRNAAIASVYSRAEKRHDISVAARRTRSSSMEILVRRTSCAKGLFFTARSMTARRESRGCPAAKLTKGIVIGSIRREILLFHQADAHRHQ